jgi:hypothetical protein
MKKLIASALLGLAAGVAPAHADLSWTVWNKDVRGWYVEGTSELGGCRAARLYEGNTIISFAFTQYGANLYIINDAWKSTFVRDANFAVTITTDGRSEPFVGWAYLDGGLMFSLSKEGILNFAEARSIAFDFKGYSLGAYQLDGSRAAALETVTCAASFPAPAPAVPAQQLPAPTMPAQPLAPAPTPTPVAPPQPARPAPETPAPATPGMDI